MKHNNFLVASINDCKEDCLLGLDAKIMEGIRSDVFASGSDFFINEKLIRLFPDHKRFIDPFSESFKILLRKKPSAEEVINVQDKLLFESYAFLKSITDEQLALVSSVDWTINEAVFAKLLADANVVDPVARFHQYMYLKTASVNGDMKTFDKSLEGQFMDIPSRVGYLKNRLKNVILESMDPRELVSKYSADDSFTFVGRVKESFKEDLETFSKEIKGKWMLITEICEGWQESQFSKKIISQYNTRVPESKFIPRRNELLVLNYDIKEACKESLVESVDVLGKEFLADVVEFSSSTEVVLDDKVDVQISLRQTLDKYAEKRRGKEMKESFDDIKKSFRRCMESIIKDDLRLKMKKLPPF
jgi:hypothetical protein